MVFRRYMAGQEEKNAPEAEKIEMGSSEGYSIGGNGVDEAQVAGTHKRIDVSDEIEADEIIEEPNVDGNQHVAVKGHGDVKVLYCTS